MRKRLKKRKKPQLNEVYKNTETTKNFAETPQLNEALKHTETPQKFYGNASKKGNTSTK